MLNNDREHRQSLMPVEERSTTKISAAKLAEPFRTPMSSTAMAVLRVRHVDAGLRITVPPMSVWHVLTQAYDTMYVATSSIYSADIVSNLTSQLLTVHTYRPQYNPGHTTYNTKQSSR